jgi:thymidine phosphorylase
MVTALGGPDLLTNPSSVFERAPITRAVEVTEAGYVAAVDTRAVGLAVVALGGGRVRVEDSVDHAVGLTEIAAVGEPVGPDRPLAVIHARTDTAADQAGNVLRAAYTIAGQPGVPGPVVASRITA